MFTALRSLRWNAFWKGRRCHSSRPVRRTPRLMLEGLETRTVPSAAAPFAPAEIAAAYGVPSPVSNPTPTTIAIVDAYNDPNIASNLKTFDSQWNITTPFTFTQVNETGGTNLPAGNASWGLEISLDVEWAHAMDPAANILLVEASSASTNDLMTAVGYAANPAKGGASVVSMSWGTSEFSGETAYDTGSAAITAATGFTGFASYPNVTFVASSGDTGAQVEWPSVSPYVVSVGGTTLSINSTTSGGGTTYSYGSESAWSAGGGGTSVYEGLPTASQGLVEPSAKARTTPDVSYDANPNSGVYVYDTYGAGGWYEVGGTSAGSPQWAAIIALADQQRTALAGALNTATVQATLYNTSTYYANFHDVTSGSNGHAATTGYDLATGLGSPKASSVVTTLTNAALLPSTIQQGPAPSNGGGGGGRGGRGGARVIVTDPAAFLIESATTTVVAAAPSSAAPATANVPVVVSAGTPAVGAASLLGGSAYESGGGGAAVLTGDATPADQAAPAAAPPEGVGNMPWLGQVFTEAVRRLQVPFAAPPSMAPAPPMHHGGSAAPLKEPAAPTPAGKATGAIPLEQVELYAIPAALGLIGVGLEREERNRRGRLPEKPR